MAVIDVIFPSGVARILAVSMAIRDDVAIGRVSCETNGLRILRLENIAKEMEVCRLCRSGISVHAVPQITVRLVGQLDSGKKEEPVLSFMESSTGEPSDPYTRPLIDRISGSHLVFAGAECENVPLKVRA